MFSLDRNARHSGWEQAVSELGSGSRVASAAFRADQANLRVQASELATSLPLQRAVIHHDRAALGRLAAKNRARITIGGKRIGRLPAGSRISSSATISDGEHALARVTIARAGRRGAAHPRAGLDPDARACRADRGS